MNTSFPYRVYSNKPEDRETQHFDCLARDAYHASEIALAAHPEIEVHRVDALNPSDSYVIYSFGNLIANEGGGFWNMDSGWVNRDQATLFSEWDREDYNDHWDLPSSIGSDAGFVRVDDAVIQNTENPPICFLVCPNGDVWRLRPGSRIAGTVQVGESDQESDLENFLDSVAECATGSASGLVDFSYQELGSGQVAFDGIAYDLSDADGATEYRILRADDPDLKQALVTQYHLADFEVEHALTSLENEYGDECCVQIVGSAREIRTPAHPEDCNYVRIVLDGLELGYWTCDEWRDAPAEVMGAIIGAAGGAK